MESNRASQIGMNELEIQRKQGKKSSRLVWEERSGRQRKLTRVAAAASSDEKVERRRADEQLGERADWRNTRRSAAATQTEKGDQNLALLKPHEPRRRGITIHTPVAAATAALVQ